MHECMDGWMDEYKGTCAQLMLCKVDMLDILHAQHSVPRSLSLSRVLPSSENPREWSSAEVHRTSRKSSSQATTADL